MIGAEDVGRPVHQEDVVALLDGAFGGSGEGIAESLEAVSLDGMAAPGASAASFAVGAVRNAAVVFFGASGGASGR